MTRILCALALVLGSLTAQEGAAACTLCAGKKTVACPGCKAQGRVRLACFACKGKGKEPCEVCCEGLDEVRKSLAAKGVKLGKGMIPCLNRYCDKKGRMRWSGGETDACSACLQKGQVKCPVCGGTAEAKCSSCSGRGPAEAACPHCAGSGTLPCPLCPKEPVEAACPLCAGGLLRTCAVCKGADQGKETCFTCGGRGGRLCDECHGLGKSACGQCGGSGKLRYVSGSSKAGVNRCETCNGSGTEACARCTKGRRRCRDCDRGNRSGCPACPLAGRVVCGSCATGGWAAYEFLGKVLFDAGHHERAAALFVVAREHARHRFGSFPIPRNPPAGLDPERIQRAVAEVAESQWPGLLGPDHDRQIELFQRGTVERLQTRLEEAKAKAAGSGHAP